MGYELTPEFKRKFLISRAYAKVKRKFRDITRRKIRMRFLNSIPSFSVDTILPFTAHMLICKKDLEMAMCSVKALNYLLKKGFNFVFHDDGSLDIQDTIFINKHAPGAKIILRDEADKRAELELSKYPMILEYRKKQVMALKLIDVKLWASGNKFCYIDSDILFFRKPDFFLEAINNPSSQNYFNKDIDNAYVMLPETINEIVGIKPLEKCNAGLWIMESNSLDLEMIENWLKHPGFMKYLFKYTLDQTYISMLATASKIGVQHLPAEYDVDFFKTPDKSVCKHYVGRIRHGYELEGLQYFLLYFK